jgi:hypothetical protein
LKLSDYKELLAENPKLAMLFDLSERFPRGPEANLRSHHYEASSDSYWDRHETRLSKEKLRGDKKTPSVIKTCTVKKHGFCPVAYGYDVLELHTWFKGNHMSDGYDFRSTIEKLLSTQNGFDQTRVEKMITAQFLGWSKQATRTRRAKRIYLRISQLRRWVQENVTTAYYKVSMGYNIGDVFVHADSPGGAQTQYDLFLKPAIAEIEKHDRNPRDGSYDVRYNEHALEGPAGLMVKNSGFISKCDERVSALEEQIKTAQAKIVSLQLAKGMVDQYSANMTCSYEYEETA